MTRSRLLLAVLTALCLPGSALAAGGNYVFDGGTPYQQQQVRDALEASSFDWSAVPATITITIAPIADSQAVPGHIWLDSSLLNAGELSWGVVQNEYAHQVDYYLLNDTERAAMTSALGATAWCYGDAPGLTLDQAGCERFASTLAVAYWQSPSNCIEQAGDVAALTPAAFRTLLATMIGPAANPAPPTPNTIRIDGPRRPAAATSTAPKHPR